MAFIKTLGDDEDTKAKTTSVSTFVAIILHQPWKAILSILNTNLTGKDSSWDTARLPILQILWGIIHSANLDYASLIWDEFKWQSVDRTSRPSKMSKFIYTHFTKLIINHFLSCNKSIPRRFHAELHSEGQDSPLTKLINTVDYKYKFGMEIPDSMITDAIKQSVGYKFYTQKKAESEKGKGAKELEKPHVSLVRSGRGKCYMRLGGQEVNVPNEIKKNVVPKKTRPLIVADNIVEEPVTVELAKSISIEEQQRQQREIMTQLTIDKQIEKDVEDMYAEWGQKLKGLVIEDQVVQSLLDLHRGSKENRLESMRQEKQLFGGERSSAC
ncbi:hypothetical protein Tco_1424579 [Tanacetum coccineum]